MQLETALGNHQLRASNYPVLLSQLESRPGKVIHVLREDLLDGGTKSRALRPFLETLIERGYQQFAYASPFAGFAQLALSYACRDLDVACHLFAEADPNRNAKTLVAHSITQEAMKVGASVRLFPSLSNAEIACRHWQASQFDSVKIPLGLDCEEYRFYLKHRLILVWNDICAQLGSIPDRVWVSLGSGTLSTELRAVLPPNIELCCINVHVLEREDYRMMKVRALPNTRYFEAPQPFASPCLDVPPIPSNLHYDAKVWAFVAEHAKSGDMWWNVAR